MSQYRLRIYKPGGVLWQTYPIPDAPDDASAKDKAQRLFDKLAGELASQTSPKIDDPHLERFTLHDDNRLIFEKVVSNG